MECFQHHLTIRQTCCPLKNIARDLGSIPGLGRSPGEGKGYPVQYSGLESSLDYTAHGVAKSRTGLSDFHSQRTLCRDGCKLGCVHIKVIRRVFKNLSAKAAPQINYIRIPRGEILACVSSNMQPSLRITGVENSVSNFSCQAFVSFTRHSLNP